MDMNQNQTTHQAKRRGKFRWSAVDTLILLLVILAIAGCVLRVVYVANQEIEKPSEQYLIQFTVSDIHKDIVAEIEKRDAVYFYETDQRLGFMAVTQDAATGDLVSTLDIKPVEGTDLVTVTGWLICFDGTMGEGGLYIEGSGRYLTPGSTVEVRTDRARFTVCITEIRENS